MKKNVWTSALLAMVILIGTLLSCKKAAAVDDEKTNPKLSGLKTSGVSSVLNPQTEWTFNEKPTTEAEQSRLKTSLKAADFDPVGLRVKSGMVLSINVEVLNASSAVPQLMVGSYDRGTVTTYNLQAGSNSISPTNAGELYIKYASASPSGGKVKITFNSGHLGMPFYELGKTTHQEWLDALATDTDTTSKNAILVANRAFLVVSKAKALEFKNEDQDQALRLIDTALKAEDDFSGMDNSSTTHASRKLKIMVTERTSGYMDATSYRIRIVTASITRILKVSDLQTNGWGVWHEFGHQHQMHQWTWNSVVGEVMPNIYTLAARRVVQPGAPGLSTAQWNDVNTFLAKPAATRIYEASSTSLITRLGLFQQLYLAFGDAFFIKVHKYYRENTITVANDDEEKRLFMINASKLSNTNLVSFFKSWGFTVNASVYDEINALNLPQPATDLSTLRE
ncbi:M60 family metallopeptidase [Pedobacter caeni]|uniref:Peptidase M60, enhancin and enhancin-like n=1 Tax=Pedobacter caeni TaxID=288992 RepID=A0A1M5BNY6_9SPHI|nr:M60 family metallopeptidase [Pedobacter caeni]SHF44274.1 Peptidase M60, enhancin and enhancin-like [Pedobacter caeni]